MELSLDTASDRVAVALSAEGALVAELLWRCRSNHSSELLPAVDQLLVHGGAAPSDLQAIFVCRGPGSYGGLRAGLSTATALAFAWGVDILGVGRLEVDAYQQAAYPGPICAVHQAGRGELGWAVYERQDDEWRELIAPRLSWAEGLLAQAPSDALFCGELTPDLIEHLCERFGADVPLAAGAASLRRPGTLAELAWSRYCRGERDSSLYVEPIYLREPQITVSRRGRTAGLA